MGKHKDVCTAGRSQLVPFRPGEAAMERHDRRLSVALDCEAIMRAWAAERGLTVRILNRGHHWLFEKVGFIAEWWPSSAKLVVNRRYERGTHVHDREQAQRQILASLPHASRAPR
jgi:hypothetical protein